MLSRTGLLTAALLAALAAPALARETRPAETKSAIDPQAIAALERMGAYLRTQKLIKVDVDTTTDDVLPNGQKVQFGGHSTVRVRRPDGLRADVVSDRKNEQIFYDGKTYTVFQPRLGYYARFDAPPTLSELVDIAEKRYGLDLPLADLFYWGTEKSRINEIRSAIKVGTSTVRGVACEHFAFRQSDVDWEICIEPSGRPLPRKLIVTTTAERSQPQHVAILSWDLNPQFSDQDFTFVPPPTAKQIEFQAVMETRRPGMRQGRSAPKSKTGGTP